MKRIVPPRILCQLRRRRAFHPKIELERDGRGERFDQRAQPKAPPLGGESLGHIGGEAKGLEVADEIRLDAGAEDLHRDMTRWIVRCLGFVHLRDGRRRDRRTKRGEDLLKRPREFELDNPARFRFGKGREPVLQSLKATRDFRPQYVGARRQELAELDRRRTHLLQRERQAHARGEGFLAPFGAPENPREKPERGGRVGSIFVRHKRVMAGEDPRHAEQCSDLAQCTEHRLHLPARMHGGDSARQITIFHLVKARFPDQSRESSLRRKPPDALGQIAVGGPIARHEFAQPRQQRKRIEIVELVEPGDGNARKFEAKEPPARSQHAIGFVKHVFQMRGVADAERDRIGVLARIFDREILRIAADPGDIRGIRLGAPPALFQHGQIDIADGDLGFFALGAGALGNAERDIARAAPRPGSHPRLRIEPIDELILPQAVTPADMRSFITVAAPPRKNFLTSAAFLPAPRRGAERDRLFFSSFMAGQ